MFHAILSLTLVGVKDTRSARAAIQNGWWGPKVLSWLVLVGLSFLVPNGFFIHFWASWVALPGSMAFILIGLVLLVDFAHTWSETCLERWEQTDSALWKWVLIGSTLGLYALTIALTAVQYAFFAGSGCALNTSLITLNWVLSLAVSALSIAPAVQESNPRSGLAQSGMVVAYTSYLTTSAIANHDDPGSSGRCNPLQSRAAGARTGMVVLGAVFTFLAIAYSTSRAATQSRAFAPGGKGKGARPDAQGEGYEAVQSLEPGELETVVRTQPRREETLRYQALKAAVEEGRVSVSSRSRHGFGPLTLPRPPHPSCLASPVSASNPVAHFPTASFSPSVNYAAHSPPLSSTRQTRTMTTMTSRDRAACRPSTTTRLAARGTTTRTSTSYLCSRPCTRRAS